MKLAREKKRKDKFVVNDPAKFSVNISQLFYESDNNDYGSVNQLEQDLEGVETNFQFSKKGAQEQEVKPLAVNERRARIEKARERLRSKKVYLEDNDAPEFKSPLNLSINNVSPTKNSRLKVLEKKSGFSVLQSQPMMIGREAENVTEPDLLSRPGAKYESDDQ